MDDSACGGLAHSVSIVALPPRTEPVARNVLQSKPIDQGHPR